MSAKKIGETIAALKIVNQRNLNNIEPSDDFLAAQPLNRKAKSTINQNSRIRASSNKAQLTAITRKEVIENIIKALLYSEISQGEALLRLRLNVTGLKQGDYAKLVNVSRKTISDIENNKGNPSGDILNKVFKPIGLKVGLIPSSPTILQNILTKG